MYSLLADVYLSCGRYSYIYGQPCEKGLEMLKTHASILSEVSVDPFTPDYSDVDEATMPCMEIVDSDDESDDDRDVMG